MRVLVTGGLGVVGSRFAQARIEAGDAVTILDASRTPRNRWTKEKLWWKWKDTGLLSVHEEAIQSIGKTFWNMLPAFDLVLHAAASTGIPYSAMNPDEDWDDNVNATKVLLDAARLHGQKCPPIVVLSSVKPYGLKNLQEGAVQSDTRWGLASWATTKGVNEAFPLEPDEPYAASKAAQSMLAMAYARSYDLPIVTLRCSNLYGPAACHGPRHGWLTWFCISAVLGRPLAIQGTGRQTRDMLHTLDVNSAVLAASAVKTRDSLKGKVFNIGGGSANTISVIEAHRLIETTLGMTVSTIDEPGRVNEDLLFVTDYTAFHDATGWSPKVSVEEGIADVVSFAKANRDALEALYAGAWR